MTTSGTISVPDVVLFTAGEHDVRAADLLMTAPHVHTHAQEVAGRGIAALATLEARHHDLEGDRREAERSFREARHLEAADDMRAWLDAWHLDVPAWRDHLAREIACELGAPLTAPLPHPASDRVWATLVLGGGLQELATARADLLAAALALGDDPDDGVVDRFRRLAVDESRIDRELTDRALDWLQVSWHVLEAPHVEAAREARMCLVDDGATVGGVSDLLGTRPRDGDGWLHRAPPDLRQLLVEVDVGGAAVVPASDATPDRVVLVRRRERPDPGDPATRDAVRTALADRALSDERRSRIRWHVTF